LLLASEFEEEVGSVVGSQFWVVGLGVTTRVGLSVKSFVLNPRTKGYHFNPSRNPDYTTTFNVTSYPSPDRNDILLFWGSEQKI
jgi:hypothetical protein